MSTKRIYAVLFLIILEVCLLSVLWEFALEDQIMRWLRGSYQPESDKERWEYVITATAFAGLALLVPGILLVRLNRSRAKVMGQLKALNAELEMRVSDRTQALSEELAERRRIGQALLREKENAEIANRAKSELLTNMSHEFRTPLNAVLGNAEILLNAELPPVKQRECLQTIYESGNLLLDLIKDLLDLSRIESGQGSLTFSPFDLHRAVDGVVQQHAPMAKDKGLELTFSCAEDVPQHVVGDVRCLQQVLSNLIDNAIKFTPKGSVSVAVTRDRQRVLELDLRFAITDTGIGLIDAQCDFIFEDFAQVDSSSTRRFGGAGLGLAISKKLLDMMGGNIGVKSQLNSGSTFWFTMPISLAQTASKTPKLDVDLVGVRALFVGKDLKDWELLCKQVESSGIRIDQAKDIQQAFKYLNTARLNADPYHVAILNHRTFGLNGRAVTSMLTQDSQGHDTSLMLVGLKDGLPAEFWTSETGFAAFVIKPLTPQELKAALNEAWRKGTSRVNPTAQLNHNHRPHVLLVEDEPVNRTTIRLMLEELGCEVDLADEARSSLKKVRVIPDLILMDVSMSELDGYGGFAEVRRHAEAHKHIPIVAVTSRAVNGDRKRWLNAGMDDHLSKPVRLAELKVMLDRWIPVSHTADRTKLTLKDAL